MMKSEERLRILEKVERGEMDVDDALNKLQDVQTPDSAPKPKRKTDSKKFRFWWLIVLAVSLAITGLGAWLGSLGGWWWLLAVPTLLGGVLMIAFALATRNAAWIHLRVNTGQDSWPRRIVISMPLPLRLAAWFLRIFQRYIPGLEGTAVDELILELERSVTSDAPIYIHVEDDAGGESVEVRLG
jgi:hypothetical protein